MRKAFFLLFITILVLITAVLIFAAVTSRRDNLPGGASPTPSVEPYAMLSFSPASLTITDSSASATQTVDIILDTSGKGVFGVQIELQYNPQVISNLEIIAPENPILGVSSSVLINTVSQEEGRATYAVGISPNEDEKKGKGAIVTLSFRVNASSNGTTEISILPISSVNNLEDEGSVLKNHAVLPIIINAQ